MVPLRPTESHAALCVRTKDTSSGVGCLKRSPEPIYSLRSGNHYTLAADSLYGGYEALAQIPPICSSCDVRANAHGQLRGLRTKSCMSVCSAVRGG